MDFLSLEKTGTHTNEGKSTPVELRIVSTRALEVPVHPMERTILIAHSDHSFEAVYFYQNLREKLTSESYEKGHLIHWPESIPSKIRDAFALHTANTAFSDEPIWDLCTNTTGKQLLSIPAFGSMHKSWSDGWITHFSETGKLLSLIPPGTPCRLYVPLAESNCSGISWQEARAALASSEELKRQCVVCFLKSTVKVEDLKKIGIRSFDKNEAACLLLLRQAFPNEEFGIQNPLPKKEWPARFKNFLDSIQADGMQGDGGLVLEEFFDPSPRAEQRSPSPRAERSEVERSPAKPAMIAVISELIPLLNERTKILDGIKA